jgi:hypothetical protein
MEENINLIPRSGVTIFRDEHSLTFLSPLSDYENHLFVTYEDAYGDAISGMLSKEAIMDFYDLEEKIMDKIFKKLKK